MQWLRIKRWYTTWVQLEVKEDGSSSTHKRNIWILVYLIHTLNAEIFFLFIATPAIIILVLLYLTR